MKNAAIATILAFALVAAAAPVNGAGGGGKVTNLLPTVDSFGATTEDVEFDAGAIITLQGEIRDKNSEKDLQQIKIVTLDGPTLTKTVTITEAMRDDSNAPGDFTDGWKVWSHNGKGNGKMAFQVQITLDEADQWSFAAYVSDEEGETASANTIDVSTLIKATISENPIGLDGTPQVGVSWGNWHAEPLAQNVEGANFMAITNTGINAQQEVLIDFTEETFSGALDQTFAVAVDGNIQFAYWEDTTGEADPTTGTYTWGQTSADGSVTLPFTTTGSIIYLKYRLVELPDALLDQDYQATYTFSPL